MLFNSYAFMFLFLPLVFFVFKVLPTFTRMHFLIFTSLVFYGYFSLEYLLLLCISIVFNYGVAVYFENTLGHKKLIFALSILVNLLPLAYFKYTLSVHENIENILFPLAISFYTFQQIAFLVDVYQKKVHIEGFEKYLFFVLFFPQLVAGPIVHYKELLTQVTQGALNTQKSTFTEAGMLLFSMGLFKKVALADGFMMLANHSFTALPTLTTADAWLGMMAYSFGIYFDFSAYSDMAIGLALLFGLRLPMNFYSPYKAENIIVFWRHWHMTLSAFLKNYLYIPLGGNRHGKSREILALLLTMLLAGIWHGTGWTFALWGLGHGLLLVLVHVYTQHLGTWEMPKAFAIALTFMSVTLLWVLFRAESLDDALLYYAILFGQGTLGSLTLEQLVSLGAGFVIVWGLPNSMQLSEYPTLKKLPWFYALGAAWLMLVALKLMAELPATSFVYFNF